MVDYIKGINDQLLFNPGNDRQSGQDGEVRSLIGEIRNAISPRGEQVGVWETIELNFADQALDAGFDRLALIIARQALAASQLSPEAYAFGLNLLHPPVECSEDINNKSDSIDARAERAGDLLEEQRRAAQSLVLDNEDAAQDLRVAADVKALKLLETQLAKADALLKKNQQAASNLLEKNDKNLSVFAAGETARVSQEKTLMHLLSASSGAYSNEGSAMGVELHSPYRLMRAEKDKSALDLTIQQKEVADELEESQLQSAMDLKESNAVDAARLRNIQEQAAENLLERQAIKAIRKRNNMDITKPKSDE